MSELSAMLRAGMREEVLRSNTMWLCVSCYHCVVRCPQEVHIADVMYTLKGMAIKADWDSDRGDRPCRSAARHSHASLLDR